MPSVNQIPIFPAEREAGLENLIRLTASVAYMSRADLLDEGRVTAIPPQGVVPKTVASKEGGSVDLARLKSLLVSTGWNLNDDVFHVLQTWTARSTPVDKPFNYEHNQKDIIGHITGASVVDELSQAVSNDISPDALPAKIHIITDFVLYKFWTDAEQQTRIDTILNEIPQGLWFVSMECLFDDFDYAIIDSKGQHRVVARDDKSAFLTKHLRAYGGDGLYKDHKVGRLLKNIIFSGKGLVRKPANPESIIFASITPFNSPVREFNTLGYSLFSDQTHQEESKVMAIETELQKQLDELRAENVRLQASLKDNDLKSYKERIDSLTAGLTDSTAKQTELSNQVKTLTEQLSAANSKAESAEKQLKASAEQIAKFEATAKNTARLKAWMEKTKVTEEIATVAVNALASLNDEQFNAFLATQQPAVAATPPASKTPDNADPKLLDNVVVPEPVVVPPAQHVEASVEKTRQDMSKFFGQFLKTPRKAKASN